MAGIRSEYKGRELAEGEKADVLGLSGLLVFPGLLQGLLCRPRGLQRTHCGFIISLVIWCKAQTHLENHLQFSVLSKEP